MAMTMRGGVTAASFGLFSIGILAAGALVAVACGGSDDSSPGTDTGDAGMTSPADGGAVVGAIDAEADAATPTPTPSIFTFVCSGSATDYCGDAGACFPTYAQAKKASSYCATKAEYVTEYPTLCDGYQMVTVRVPVIGDIDYYYDANDGHLIAVVNLEEQTACIGAGSPPYGEVRLDPCTVKTNAITTSVPDACNGVVDSGGASDTDAGGDDGADAGTDAGFDAAPDANVR